MHLKINTYFTCWIGDNPLINSFIIKTGNKPWRQSEEKQINESILY